MPASWEAGKFFSCYGCRTPMPGSPLTGDGKENLCPFPWESRRLFSPRAHPQARLAVYRRRERKPLPLPLGKLVPFLTAGAPHARLAVYRRRERKPLPLTLGEPAPFLTAGAPHAGLAVYRRRERKPLPLPLGKLVPFLTAGAPHARLAVYRRRERKPLPLTLGEPAPFLTAGAPPGQARRSPGAAGCSCAGAGRRACKSTRISPRRCRTQ